MKYWRGYLTAAIFGVISWALMAFAQRFTTLVDMVYPYVMRTLQTILTEWSSGVSFNLWQLGIIALGIVGLASIVAMVVLKWNPFQWFGWVLAAASCLFMLHTLMYGLNYYAGPLADDVRLEVVEYNIEELTDAAAYYRDKANGLAEQVDRDENGNVRFPGFEELAQQAADGFDALTHEYSFPVFAGSTEPVKQLAWADLFTSQGITGVTIGITGEAAVNPQIPPVSLPFTICHEMAHRMCIATERDGNFAGFLACMANESVDFQYSAYFMAYRYCYNALLFEGSAEASAAAARVGTGANEKLKRDLQYYDDFFAAIRGEDAASLSSVTVSDGDGVPTYGTVCDLLVSWHIQEIVLPAIAVEETPFDPFDENQVDLSGIVNARPKETEPNG